MSDGVPVVNEQHGHVNFAVQFGSKPEIRISFTPEAKITHVRVSRGRWREHIVDSDQCHAHPSHLLDQVWFEKFEGRNLAPIDHGWRLTSLRDRIAALLIDLHLVAKCVSKRGAHKSVGRYERKPCIGERRFERTTRVLVNSGGSNLVVQPT